MSVTDPTRCDTDQRTTNRIGWTRASRVVLASWFTAAALTVGSFLFGVGVGVYQWPPFQAIQSAKQFVRSWLPRSDQRELSGDSETLDIAFADPVSEVALHYPPIHSLRGIREANERIFTRQDGFETAYTDLQVIDATQLDRPIGSEPVVCVQFRYQGAQHAAFAYGRLPMDAPVRKWATLIIPGSGLNQSLPISTDDRQNYHFGIQQALSLLDGSVFTLIKPNEDLLAWHNGHGRKLRGSFIWNWHLNRGGSYSISYLVQSLAFMKWMQSCFSSTMVAGLSQGGAAALLNAAQSRPDRAVVASGYTLVNSDVEWSGHNQIIGVREWARLSELQVFLDLLRNSPTKWFFSWGKAEDGPYRVEANGGPTAEVLGNIPTVTVVLHEGGHVFPAEDIAMWLSTAESSP